MTEETYIPEDSCIIVLSSAGDDLIIRTFETFTDDIDEDTEEYLMVTQQGLATLAATKLDYVRDIGNAALASYEEGLIEALLSTVKDNLPSKKPKSKKTGKIVSLFDKEEKKDGED